jgi:hypothetical protein
MIILRIISLNFNLTQSEKMLHANPPHYLTELAFKIYKRVSPEGLLTMDLTHRPIALVLGYKDHVNAQYLHDNGFRIFAGFNDEITARHAQLNASTLNSKLPYKSFRFNPDDFKISGRFDMIVSTGSFRHFSPLILDTLIPKLQDLTSHFGIHALEFATRAYNNGFSQPIDYYDNWKYIAKNERCKQTQVQLDVDNSLDVIAQENIAFSDLVAQKI